MNFQAPYDKDEGFLEVYTGVPQLGNYNIYTLIIPDTPKYPKAKESQALSAAAPDMLPSSRCSAFRATKNVLIDHCPVVTNALPTPCQVTQNVMVL